MEAKTRNLFATGHKKPGSALQIDMVALANNLLANVHPMEPIVVFSCKCGCEDRPGHWCPTCGERPVRLEDDR